MLNQKKSVENKRVSKTNLGILKELYISIKRKQKMHKTHYTNGFSIEKYFKTFCENVNQNKNFSKKTLFPSLIG